MTAVKRTYGGRRGTGASTLDYREILQDNTSIFDSLSIKNLKKLRKDTAPSYATWSNQPKKSSRTHKKLVKKIGELETELVKSILKLDAEDSQPLNTCLTPDKSLRVNRTPDPFDLLCASSAKDDTFNKLVSKEKSASVWCCKKEIENHPMMNITPDESVFALDNTKEVGLNMPNNSLRAFSYTSQLHSSDMNNYELKVERASDEDEELSDSIKNVVNNVTFYKELAKMKVTGNKSQSNMLTHKSTSTPLRKQSLLTSTPNVKTRKKKYSMNISPINANKSKLIDISVNKYIINISASQNTQNKNSKEILSPQNTTPLRERNSIIDDNIKDYSNYKQENTPELNENNTIIDEPFLGFSNHNDVGLIPQIYNKLLKCENKENQVSPITSIPNTSNNDENNSKRPCRLTTGSTSSSESCNSITSFKSCDSFTENSGNDNNYQYNKKPVVVLTQMDDSLLNKYYTKYTKLSGNTSSDTNSTTSSSDSTDDELTQKIANVNVNNSLKNCDHYVSTHEIRYQECNKEDNNSIFSSSESDYTDVDSDSYTSSQTTTSSSPSVKYQDEVKVENVGNFITLRRGNDFFDDSVMILEDSSESDNKENTVLVCTDLMIESDFPKNNSSTSKSKELNISTNETEYNVRNIDNNSISSNNIDTQLQQEIISNLDPRPSIKLLPGKKWERSLVNYRRETMRLNENKIGRRETFFEENTRDSLYINDSVCDQRSTICRNLRRSTLKIVKEPCANRASLSILPGVEDEICFISEDCDDTLREFSRLSLSSTLDETVVEKGRPETSARDVLLLHCDQAEPLPFHECYPDVVLKNCRKIGEGVYGEVFLYRGQNGRARVMKVVPVQGDTLVNGETQKTYDEIISEVVIAMKLSALRTPITEIERVCDAEGDGQLEPHAVNNATDAFTEVLAVRLVYGSYPARLLDLWELYEETHGTQNDNPVSLPPQQAYVVLELANAGLDLEAFVLSNAEQAYAVFYQVAFALAVGEEAYQFEHRDLHWGNVLLQNTEQKFGRFVLRGRVHSVARRGVAATVIDYTLSRVALPLAGGEAVLYNNLAGDEQLFCGVGDGQFDVYRRMRERTGNDWKKFEPHNNVLWLDYLLDKMITALRYKRTNTKVHKHFIAKLKAIKDVILDYDSAVHFVLGQAQ